MKRRIAKDTLSKWVFFFSLTAASIVLYKSFDRISDVFGWIGSLISLLTPIVAAFGIAFFLNRPTQFMERQLKRIKKVPFIGKHARGFSVAIVYIITLAVIALIIYAIVPALISGITSIIGNSEMYIESAKKWFSELSVTFPILAEFDIGTSVIGMVETFLAGLNVDTILKYLQSIAGVGGSVGSTLANIAVSMFVSVYMLLEKEDICAAIGRISSLVLRERTIRAISNYLAKANVVVYRYFTTQFADCVIVSVMATIALAILKAPSPILLGFVFGMFNIIPYFGPIIAGVGVVLVILFSRGFGLALTSAIVLLILQQLDANVINPRFLGASLEIGPFWVILAITLGGGLFGFAGMLLGVPTMVIVRMVYRDALRFRRHWKEWKREDKSDPGIEPEDDPPKDDADEQALPAASTAVPQTVPAAPQGKPSGKKRK